MGIARGGLDLGVTEQFPDHRGTFAEGQRSGGMQVLDVPSVAGGLRVAGKAAVRIRDLHFAEFTTAGALGGVIWRSR